MFTALIILKHHVKVPTSSLSKYKLPINFTLSQLKVLSGGVLQMFRMETACGRFHPAGRMFGVGRHERGFPAGKAPHGRAKSRTGKALGGKGRGGEEIAACPCAGKGEVKCCCCPVSSQGSGARPKSPQRGSELPACFEGSQSLPSARGCRGAGAAAQSSQSAAGLRRPRWPCSRG